MASSARGVSPDTALAWKVPLADLLVDDEILSAAGDALASGWWTMGPRVEEFETAFASYVGARHALAVSNGTAALHLALLGAGCTSGDEVVLPSLNFVAAANSVAHTGARPVFCDIRGEGDLNLDPADVEAAIGPSTKAIVVLHYGGYCCDIDTILDIARRHELLVIEDAAHAPGASSRGRMCGTFGAAGCFSFFSNKNLPVGEGGMVVTDDDSLADRVRVLRSHGMTTLTWARHQGHAHSYDVVAQGLNYRLDEPRAAIGLVQLARLEAANRARATIVARYRRELDGVAGMSMPFAEHDSRTSAHHLAALVLPRAGCRRRCASICTPAGFRQACTTHRSTRSPSTQGQTRPLPVTDGLSRRLITLPLYPHMRDDQVELVIDGVLELVAPSGP